MSKAKCKALSQLCAFAEAEAGGGPLDGQTWQTEIIDCPLIPAYAIDGFVNLFIYSFIYLFTQFNYIDKIYLYNSVGL